MDNSIYKKPESNVDEGIISFEASAILKLFCVFLALTLIFLGAIHQYIESGGRMPETVGGAIGGVIWPLFVVGIFQIWKRFRNQKSRYKIFMWTALVILVSMLLTFISLLASFAKG